jgi:hypothetical protein
MPPRTGQLDQISESIGEIRAYVHAGRHDITNLTQIVNALDATQIKRHSELKAEVGERIDKGLETMRSEIAIIAARVAILEEKRARQTGGDGVWKWLAATALAAFAAVAAWWRPHP